MPNITKPLELLQLLLMENTSQDEFLDFQKRFQSFIDQSPSFLHSVGKKGFFPSFFFGAFATLLDSRLANFDGVQVKQIYFRFNKYGDLKLAVLTEDSKTQNEKLICIAVSDNEDQEHKLKKLKFSKEELANIASQIFPDLAQNQESQSRHTKCKIVEYNVTINKEKKVACNLVENFKDFNKLSALTSTRAKEFTPVRSQGVNLESLIGKLADKNHAQVMNTMKEVLDYITGVYSKYKNDRGIKKQFEGKESSYHGFLAGFLMNFKYRYHLKLYLELFAGKGQADIILLVRGANKSPSSIPIIIELKAGTDVKSTSQKAMEQVQDYVKGSFSNFVRMVTTASEVICVGLNFEMNNPKHAKYSFFAERFLNRKGNSVIEKSLSIPQIMESITKIVNSQLELRSLLRTRTEKVTKDTIQEKLEKLGKEEIDEIIKNRLIGLFGQNENKVDKQRLKELLENLPNICTAEIIRKQLEYLYYGIVWSNGGSDNIHYVSQFILGQLMLVPDITDKKKSVAKYVFTRGQDVSKRTSKCRINVVDKYTLGCVRTTVLIIDNEVFVLNITEMSKENKESLKATQSGNTTEREIKIMEDNKIVPIENIERIKKIDNVKIYEINCHLRGTPSNKNPFGTYCKKDTGVQIRPYTLDQYKENRDLLQGNFPSIDKNKKFNAALKKAIKSCSYDNYKEVFKEISCMLYPFKSLINNEATFQAVLHGLFSSCSDDHIKVITEFQIGGGDKLDIMLIIKATDGVKEYPPVGIELKFAKEKELNKRVKEAEDQLERYQKGEAYKVVTDADKVKLMYAIFDQGAKDGNSLISIKNKSSEKFKEVDFVEVVAKHSSDIMLPGQQPTGNVQQPAAQRAGHSRAVNQ